MRGGSVTDKKRDRISRTDGFWDIDVMLPEKKRGRAFSGNLDAEAPDGTELVEISLSSEYGQRKVEAIPPRDHRTDLCAKSASEPHRQTDRATESSVDLSGKIQKELFGKDGISSAVKHGLNTAKNALDGLPKELLSDRLRAAREALDRAQKKIDLRSAVASGEKGRGVAIELFPDLEQAAEKDAGGQELSTEAVEYCPEGSSLIRSVKILPWPSRYSFYKRFREDALSLFDRAGRECKYTPYFSYTPQYSQLTPPQLSYYLYWRECVRKQSYPKGVDFAYILLFLYEIINLPDKISAEGGAKLLLGIWTEYREEHPRLDALLSEWFCDYCLIRQLPLELTHGEAVIKKALEHCSLKEFYLAGNGKASPYASALFTYCSSYDFLKSKFITNENRALFEKHVRDASIFALECAEQDGTGLSLHFGKEAMVPHRIVREAFRGGLCAYDVKKRIEIEYLSCSRSVELRYAVTDTVKYAENNVRAMLGIRSRFHVPSLPASLKNAVDRYFAPYKKTLKRSEKKAEAPEYERLYEPEVSELSLEYAKDIEKRAWQVTELLTDFTEEEISSNGNTLFQTDSKAPEEICKDVPENNGHKEQIDASDIPLFVKEGLICLLDRDQSGFLAVAQRNNILPDSLIELINDTLYDELGDIASEQRDNGFYVIEDYREDILRWIK